MIVNLMTIATLVGDCGDQLGIHLSSGLLLC